MDTRFWRLPRSTGGRWLVAIVGLFAAAATHQWMSNIHFEGDTGRLLAGASEILACLERGQLTRCTGAQQFPLLQYLPGIFFKLFGDHAIAARWLVVLNLFSFFAILVWTWRSLRTLAGARLAALLVCVIASGPLLPHARTSFSEMISALATLAFAIRCLERAGGWGIFGWLVLAGISKETAIPFLLLMGLLATYLGRARARDARPLPWVPIACGAAIAIGANIAFNYFRFGSPINEVTLEKAFIVQDLRTHVSFALGIWFSPNGGLLFFWPVFFVLCAVGGAVALRETWSRRGWREQLTTAAPAVVVGAVLAGLTVGFGKWHAPLGWESWGPRLMFPWIPALAYLLVVAYAEPLDRVAAAVARRLPAAVIVSILWVAVALPELVFVFRSAELQRLIFVPDATCPPGTHPKLNAAQYYRCIEYLLWTRKSALWEAYRSLRIPLVAAYVSAWSLLLGVLVYRSFRWTRGVDAGAEEPASTAAHADLRVP
jgi:hypothetical protein